MEERPAKAHAAPPLQPFVKNGRGVSEPYFSTPELRQRLDLLRHLTDNSEKILLVKGEDGAGKSTFVQQFRKLARDEWDLCCMDASHTFQPDQFFAHLYRRFGLTDEASLNIEQLLRRFELLSAAGRLPVIVIDDAHLLPVATIIAIFRLFERRPGNRALIRIVLFATPDIVRQFQTPQLQAMNLQSVQSLEMPLLDSDQSRSFVQFLLDLGGESKHLKLGSGALNRLVRDAVGLPGLLEAQLQRLFSDTPKPAKVVTAIQPVDKGPERGLLSDLPKPVLLGAGVLGILLMLTLIFQNEINELFLGSSQEERIASVGPAGDKTTRPLQLPEAPAEIQRAPSPGVMRQNQIALDGVIETKEADLILPNAHRQELLQAEAEESPVSASAPLLENELMTEVQEVDGRGDSEQMAIPAPLLTMSDAVSSQAENPLAQREIPAEMTQPVQQVLKAVEQPMLPATSAKGAESGQKEVKVAPSTQAVVGIRREKWLLEQAPKSFTLQLIGVRDERAVKSFIEQYRLTGEVAYFRMTRSGGAWFSVLYGVYPTRDAAVKARSNLPVPLRKSDVWPRTFASVQAAIKSP
ncbi:AAA family ATPase [Sedimenticola selenatireducens]|nr:AAA family ATPase [Sedimenticola selenatireducens]